MAETYRQKGGIGVTMSATRYDEGNAAFSNKAHAAARNVLYPLLFDAASDKLSFDNDTLLQHGERGAVLDGQMGIDRIVNVTVDKLRAPLRFTVQERFRRPNYTTYRDLTVTEWNHASNLPSELYKITADYFLYGYYDDAQGVFQEAIAISVPDLLLSVSKHNIPYVMKPNKKQQTFLAFKFDDLDKAGLIRLWYPKDYSTKQR